MEESKKLIVFAVVVIFALAIGAVAGYLFGFNAGKSKGAVSGKETLLEEQAQVAVEAEKARLLELQDAANPFKGSYQNPFAD